MKKIANVVVGLSISCAIAFSAMAAEPVKSEAGLVRMGMISVSNAGTLSDLESQIKEKAEQQNASYYKIVSARGGEYFYGNAILFK
ncbi:MqsR-controlled colanic acid and biofilm protein A [Enterobacter sp. BIGb0383]|uniref:DUF1471 domain-containing protein n=1 Tax=unclassified Enterobacter TaxID=2608935 RepID=UPI000F4674E3|nr:MULTISPECIES: DUF1471 domain-containing protein [unclassified Enterobacter]ROP61832.1 MqsR-controlled colanic acid and biofilm protein A [Enterobacter sp. BIGb0383]ROS11993.1 MqsR-controlled colanic acid and biofilm protein A [Enterobacter sp. BIGb0359]